MDEDKIELNVTFSYNTASGLFTARLENGTQFSVIPNNVSGKLGENLDLLRLFTVRHTKGEPPRPHVSATKPDPDAALIEEAIRAGKLQRVGVVDTTVLLDLD